MPAQTRPLSEIGFTQYRFDADATVPNNPALPVIVVQGGLMPDQDITAICALLMSNRWGGNWAHTVFDFPHYHPNAHETLVAARGSAVLQIGGPSGDAIRVTSGDYLILPAGTGHCLLQASPDFKAVGGYPVGQEDYESVRAGAGTLAAAKARIAAVPLPMTCPIFGEAGLLVPLWTDT